MEDALLDNFDFERRKAKKNLIIYALTTLILLSTTIIFIILYFDEKNDNDDDDEYYDESPKKDPDHDDETPQKEFLTLWEDNYPKTTLIEFVNKISDESNPDFVKKEDRIAVFDLDGTLFQETDPTYTDLKLFKYRVLDDYDYKDKATDEEKEIASEIANLKPGDELKYNPRQAELNAIIFKDMTLEQFYAYVQKFLEQESDGYNNMKRGDAFYKPMVEVIDYLQNNDFTVYIVSGSDRFLVRAIVERYKDIKIDKNNIIGTDVKVVGKDQNNTDGFDYTLKKDEELIFNGTLIEKNLYFNKVTNIIREIGKIPILSFGNSNGDSSMANLVISNGRGLAFMLLCDDGDREIEIGDKVEDMKKLCKENDWIEVSMKNDWRTIYGYNVTKKS